MTLRVQPWRYATWGLLAIFLVLLIAGIGQFTWWKPSPVVTFTSARTAIPVVMTGKNVLESTGESVEITATGEPKQEIFLAVGLTSDVSAFAKPIEHVTLTDFESGSTFTAQSVKPVTQKPAAEKNTDKKATSKKPAAKKSGKEPPQPTLQELAQPQQEDIADFRSADIWKQSASGTGKASLKWTLSDSRWSAIAFTLNPQKGTPGPRLSLRWEHESSMASAWVLTIVGALGGIAVGTYLVLSQISEFRSRARRRGADKAKKTRELATQITTQVGAAPAASSPVSYSTTSPVSPPVSHSTTSPVTPPASSETPSQRPTRRSLRLAEKAAAEREKRGEENHD